MKQQQGAAASEVRFAAVGQAGDGTEGTGQLLYTVREAADLLRIGRSSLYELMATSQLSSITIGSRRLILAEDLMAFIATRRREAA